MSASDYTAAIIADGVASDIWQQHESQIRDLYQKKKKTLKQVKEEMEKKGFPKKPLSTWEAKVRVDLKIRKKNKAADWPLIYRHLAHRLEEPGKKRLKQPTMIRQDGREIPFDEAWKEIRRSGATHFLHVCMYAARAAIRGGPLSLTYTASAFLNDISPTPWVSLYVNMRSLLHHGINTRVLDAWKSLEWWNIVPGSRALRTQDIGDFEDRVELLATTSPRQPRPSNDLGYRLVTSRGNISLGDFVSTSIYLLSNGLHDLYDNDRGLHILCALFEHDTQLFAQLLECESSTGRAAWDSLFIYSQFHQDKLVFEFLLDMGMRYSWLDPFEVGALVSLERVLRLGANLNAYTAVSHRDLFWNPTMTPLQVAASQGKKELVELFLIRGANVNSPARGPRGRTALQAICHWGPATEEEHRRKMAICNLLLIRGADVNAAPALSSGMTALQGAAARGDMELTAMLISNGAHVNAPPSKYGPGYCALDFAASHGRLDVAKLLLVSAALSSDRGMTGYDGAIEAAQKNRHHAVARLIRNHPKNGQEQRHHGLETEMSAKDYQVYGYNTDDESADDNYGNEWSPYVRQQQDWLSMDESLFDCDVSERGKTSRLDSRMAIARMDDPRDTQKTREWQVAGNTLMDDFMGHKETPIDLTVHASEMQWQGELMPGYSMGSLSEIYAAQSVPELQFVPDAPTEDWLGHPGTGFVSSQGDMQSLGRDSEWAFQNIVEMCAGMPGDSTLWQQVFAMQEVQFGFPTIDPRRQLISTDQFDGPDIDEQDATGRQFSM